MYTIRELPEPFFCKHRNVDSTYPPAYARQCDRQCVWCECYQEGWRELYDPAKLPAIQYGIYIDSHTVWVFKWWDEDWMIEFWFASET